MTDLSAIIAEWRESGTPGPWVTPFDFMDHGWSLDTEGENSCVGIGHNGAPLVVHCVERAFGLDELQLADAFLIASAPSMADRIESLEEELGTTKTARHADAEYIGHLESENAQLRNLLNAAVNGPWLPHHLEMARAALGETRRLPSIGDRIWAKEKRNEPTA